MHDTQAEVKEKVRRYYHATTEDYLKYYQTDWHHHMHFGFDRDLPRGGNPTEHLVRYLADVAELGPGQSVLDAGCGVGGSSIWLARERGCRCVGITLVESQARLAMGFAAAGKVLGAIEASVAGDASASGHARFAVNDFQTPAFKPESFDAVWAVESFDHAPDKAAWVREMSLLLKPGGRLIIADGFRAQDASGPKQAKAYRSFLAGWAVPHLCSFDEMKAYASDAGLETRHAEDLSRDVLPHSLAIFRFGLLFIPWRWLLRRLGLTSHEKLGNAYATYFQYRTLKQGLWNYGVFCFRKPD
jgi:tocopherol O-methyltransferase